MFSSFKILGLLAVVVFLFGLEASALDAGHLVGKYKFKAAESEVKFKAFLKEVGYDEMSINMIMAGAPMTTKETSVDGEKLIVVQQIASQKVSNTFENGQKTQERPLVGQEFSSIPTIEKDKLVLARDVQGKAVKLEVVCNADECKETHSVNGVSVELTWAREQ